MVIKKDMDLTFVLEKAVEVEEDILNMTVMKLGYLNFKFLFKWLFIQIDLSQKVSDIN